MLRNKGGGGGRKNNSLPSLFSLFQGQPCSFVPHMWINLLWCGLHHGLKETLLWCLKHVFPSFFSHLDVCRAVSLTVFLAFYSRAMFFYPFLSTFSPRSHHLSWGAQPCPVVGSVGADWKWPCPARGSPGLSSQRPPQQSLAGSAWAPTANTSLYNPRNNICIFKKRKVRGGGAIKNIRWMRLKNMST